MIKKQRELCPARSMWNLRHKNDRNVEELLQIVYAVQALEMTYGMK